MTVRAFGRHPDAAAHHDPRSRSFPAGISPLRTVVHKHAGPVLDQGSVSACTGYATAGALNAAPNRGRRRLLAGRDALALYTRATRIDPYDGWYPDTDGGSDGLSAAKAAREAGYISSFQHAFGVGHALGALVNAPIIVGTLWRESMSSPGRDGFVRLSGEVVGGHEWAIIGLNVEKQYVIALQSWGAAWGMNGRFFVSFEDFGALLADGGDATVLVR